MWNKCDTDVDTHEYYKQLYKHLNTLFFNLNKKLCDNTTQFTILSLDIVIRDGTLYLKEFNYHDDGSFNNELEDIYDSLYKNQVGNDYIRIYPMVNTYNMDNL